MVIVDGSDVSARDMAAVDDLEASLEDRDVAIESAARQRGLSAD